MDEGCESAESNLRNRRDFVPRAESIRGCRRQSNRKAATAATSDLSTWATTTLPGQAVPPSTDAVS